MILKRRSVESTVVVILKLQDEVFDSQRTKRRWTDNMYDFNVVSISLD